MPDLRWYLKREGGEIALVVERRSDRKGFRAIVRSRRHALEWLPELRLLTMAIGQERVPERTYSPEVVDA